MARLLVVDDDATTRRTLERLMARYGHDVVLADRGQAASTLLQDETFDLVLLDLGLPDKDGLEILAEEQARRADAPGPPIIVVSARDDMQSTIAAVQRGAYDYVIKPVDIDLLLRVVARAIDEGEVRRQIHGIEPDRQAEPAGQLLVGRSPQMRETYKTIAQVSKSRSTVLITGESGTGKELAARAIHAFGDDEDAPFIAVNCAALAPGLLESELFGHRRGAFTGAVADRAGRFEAAGSGTLFLDEIGEMPLDLQAKLLRVLQERTYERVGETTERPFEARVLAATHRDVDERVRTGEFREDLLYRLRVVELRLPALRDRIDDIPLLVERLLARAERDVGRSIRAITPEAVDVLERHRWPGNVRELYNVLQRAVVLARSDVITPDLIALAGLDDSQPTVHTGPNTARSLADVERAHILAILQETAWHKKRTAELLGISRPTLDRKIKLYELRPDPDE